MEFLCSWKNANKYMVIYFVCLVCLACFESSMMLSWIEIALCSSFQLGSCLGSWPNCSFRWWSVAEFCQYPSCALMEEEHLQLKYRWVFDWDAGPSGIGGIFRMLENHYHFIQEHRDNHSKEKKARSSGQIMCILWRKLALYGIREYLW